MNKNVNYGWVCPVCGAVMSPYTFSCINCSGTDETYGGKFEVTCNGTTDLREIDNVIFTSYMYKPNNRTCIN
jgi:hypothetical protein